MTHLDAEQIHQRRWWALAVLCFSLLVIGSTTPSSTWRCPGSSETSTPPPASSSGSSTATPSCSPACCSPRAASATASAARAPSASAWSSSASARWRRRSPRSPTTLIATRALMGIGGALIMPATLSHPHQRLHRPQGAGPGHRRLGRRRRRQASPSARSSAAALLQHFWWGSVFLVNVPVVHRRPGRRLLPAARPPVTPRRPGSTRSARCCRSSASCTLLWAIIEAPTKGWGSDTDPQSPSSSALVAAGRLHRLGAAHRPPDARRALLQEPPGSRAANVGHHPDVLRPVRLDASCSPSTCSSCSATRALKAGHAPAADAAVMLILAPGLAPGWSSGSAPRSSVGRGLARGGLRALLDEPA